MRSPHPATAQLPAGTPPAPQHTSMLATGFDDSLMGMALVGTDGRFLHTNRALCRMLGRGEEELTTLSFADVTHPDDIDLSRANLDRALAGAVRGFRLRKRYRHADGRVVWAVLTTSLLRDGEGTPLCFFSQVFDLTEEAPDPEAGPTAAGAPRQFVAACDPDGRFTGADPGGAPEGGRLLGVEPDERARISRELHDGLGQILTSIALFAKAIEDEVPAAHRRRVASLRTLVDEALVSTRSLVWSLRPAELNRSGLLYSLTRLARGAGEQARLRVHVDARGLVGPLSPTIETTLYRFVQEALGNVMRHASANSVAIVLSRSEFRVTAVVEDDGVGFEPAEAAAGGGVGLYSMQERARLAGGELRIESAPGRGTSLRLDIPCGPARPAVR